MIGIKIALGTIIASGGGIGTLSQLDPGTVVDIGKEVGGMTPTQIMGTLCVICILSVMYMVYKLITVLLPALEKGSVTSDKVSSAVDRMNASNDEMAKEIRRCHDKNA